MRTQGWGRIEEKSDTTKEEEERNRKKKKPGGGKLRKQTVKHTLLGGVHTEARGRQEAPEKW